MLPVLASLGSITLYTFGAFISASLFFASFIVWKRGREANLSDEEIFDGVIAVALTGLVGARLAYILLHFDRFGLAPLAWASFLRIPGMFLIGGLLGGGFTLYLISRRKRWPFYTMSDIAVTGLSLGQSIGWLGAFGSGFGVGKTSMRWGLTFPGYGEPRFPAQFLWVVGYFVLFLFLWKVEDRYRTFEWYKAKRAEARNGFLSFSYLSAFGILTLLRPMVLDVEVYWLGIPRAAIAGVLLTIAGIVGLFIRSGRSLPQDFRSVLAIARGGIRSFAVSVRQGVRKVRRGRPLQ